MTTQDVSTRGPRYSDDELLGIDSFDAALELAQRELGGIAAADQEIGNGFSILDNDRKDILVGAPMLLLSWNFNIGDFGPFVSAMVVAKVGGQTLKYVLNDGSSGIFRQLDEYSNRTGRMGGLIVRKGLRVSEYEYEDPQSGEKRPAKTYYLDTSA